MPEMKTLTIGSEKFDIKDETAVHSWEEIPDKPFSKETDPAVYVVSAFEQLPQVKGGAEEYSYGTFLFEAEKIPGSVEALFSIDGSTRAVPISELNGFQQGRFSIWGSTFCIYCEMNRFGRYDIYALAKSENAFGAELHFKNFAYIDHLPTEYINVTDLRNNVGTWATMPDKPFAVEHYDLGTRLNIKDFRENTSNDNVIAKEKYPYISSLVSVLDYRPDWVTFYAYGSHTTIAIRDVNDVQYIGHDVSTGSFNGTVYIEQKTDGFHVYFLSKNMISNSMGYLESAAVANPLDIRALPIREIAFKVKEILGL